MEVQRGEAICLSYTDAGSQAGTQTQDGEIHRD